MGSNDSFKDKIIHKLFVYKSYAQKERIWHSSSSSCRATSTDIPDPLLPPLPIVHHFRQVLRATPRILTEQLCVGSRWLPCFCSAI